MWVHGGVFFFPRVVGVMGYVPVIAPQALVPRQVRGVASWAGHCNEAHLNLIIITHLFLSLVATSRRRQIILVIIVLLLGGPTKSVGTLLYLYN